MTWYDTELHDLNYEVNSGDKIDRYQKIQPVICNEETAGSQVSVKQMEWVGV